MAGRNEDVGALTAPTACWVLAHLHSPVFCFPNRGVPLLGQPAALPVLPGAVPDGPVRGGRGIPVPRGAAAEPQRARSPGALRAAAAAQVLWPECPALWVLTQPRTPSLTLTLKHQCKPLWPQDSTKWYMHQRPPLARMVENSVSQVRKNSLFGVGLILVMDNYTISPS